MTACGQAETALDVDREALVDAFNDAYSIYPIPMSITGDRLDFLLRHRNFEPALSAIIRSPAGSIDAFWLTGVAPQEVPGRSYAIALGVRPERTGAGLARAAFDHVRRLAATAGYGSMTLEVIAENTRARRLYERLGFVETRRLVCFRGEIKVGSNARGVEAPALLDDMLQFTRREARWTPTWQNAGHALKNIEDDLDIRLVMGDGACVAAGALIRSTRTIAQLVTAKSREQRGHASAILAEWVRVYGDRPFTVLNIDANAAADLAFYAACGLKLLLTQLEMTAPLASLDG